MLKVEIIGQGSLAEAVRNCCALHFEVTSSEPKILWVCYDTPIGRNFEPDAEWVFDRVREKLPKLMGYPLILISSQLPVGSTKRLELEFPAYTFAYSPENIRVASAMRDFAHQSRVVIGRRTESHDFLLSSLFLPFTQYIIFTDPETAELVKHALNCWLGMNIAFINEIARVAGAFGADSNIISTSLLAEPRVGPLAPLRPGAPFGLGHLARDIRVMVSTASSMGISIPIITHIQESNAVHANFCGDKHLVPKHQPRT